jgi:hypothetical protein
MSTTQLPNAAPTASQSKELNSLQSEETSLRSELTKLETWQDRWHRAYLLLAFFTVALGILSGVSQFLESKNAYRVRPINVRLSQIEIRAREIENDVTDKYVADTLGIAAEANREAATAHDSAAKANERARRLEREASQLKQANLETESRLTAANAEISDVNAKRLELERSLAPRTFGANGKIVNLDKLKEFAGLNIVLRYLPDAESERAASVLVGVLLSKEVGWKMSAAIPDPTKYVSFFDGVLVQWSTMDMAQIAQLEKDHPSTLQEEVARLAKVRELSKDSERSSWAAEELVDFLKKNGWQAREMPAGHNEIPPNSVGITVGFKPNPYFDPEEIKKISEQMEKIRQESLEERHREEEEEKKFRPNE